MFNKRKISEDDLDRYNTLRLSPLVLDHSVPLMPDIKTRWGWKSTLRLMAKIKTLPAGTSIILKDIKLRGAVPWYFIGVKDSLVTGWLNSTVLNRGASNGID